MSKALSFQHLLQHRKTLPHTQTVARNQALECSQTPALRLPLDLYTPARGFL
jgi:hypothetical protein